MLMQGFSWTLLPGVLPFKTSFRVPKGELNQALLGVQNPTSLKIECWGGTQGKPDPVVLEFQQLYLLEPKEIDPFHVMWTIADSRWSWRGKLLHYSYNKTRKANVKGQGVNASDTTPASLRQYFDTFATGRYLSWSLKGMEVPWTMKEILEDQMAKHGIPFDPNFASDDGAYIIENVEADGIDIYRGFAQLLAASRMNIGIKPNGQVYVYSQDYFDDTQINLIAQYQNQAKTKPGTIYFEDKSRIRPRKVNVKFKKKMEVRVVATKEERPGGFLLPITPKPPIWSQKDIDEWRVIGCQNVISCPYPVFSPFSNREIHLGEWLPLWEYLASLNPPITEQEIREYYFSEAFERYYAAKLDGGTPSLNNEAFVHHIVTAIKGAYRRIYQLNPYIMDRIEYWEPRRVAVIDNYSRYSPTAPLFADYCVIPGKRHPSQAKQIALWSTQAYNWYVDQKDPLRQKPTAGTIRTVDQALGIFQVSYPSSPDRTIKTIIPSALDPLPSPLVDGNLLETCHLVENHTLDTIISVIWSNYRNEGFDSPKRFYSIPIDFSHLGGKGPEIDYLSSKEHARLSVREYSTQAGLGIAGSIIYDPNTPTNLGILEAIAQSEAGRLMNQFKDRYSGLVTLAGKVDVALTGNMKGVSYVFSPKSGLETIVDLRDRPPDPTLEQQLPQRAIAYLMRQVPTGEESPMVSRI
ncbi:MAG: hypothetical protein DRI56_03210 [Chloroflexota bacterium]|nr:MAG: hypothetical protein DRI56_03210 [Chloroflexota bacterium]